MPRDAVQSGWIVHLCRLEKRAASAELCFPRHVRDMRAFIRVGFPSNGAGAPLASGAECLVLWALQHQSVQPTAELHEQSGILTEPKQSCICLNIHRLLNMNTLTLPLVCLLL